MESVVDSMEPVAPSEDPQREVNTTAIIIIQQMMTSVTVPSRSFD